MYSLVQAINYFIVVMILAKIREEEISNFPISRKEKLLNRIKNPFRTTTFTIQKRKTLDQHLTLSPD